MLITTAAVELVVRPSDSGGGGEAGCDSDYEPGEVRRDPPPYSRSDRFSNNLLSLFSLRQSAFTHCLAAEKKLGKKRNYNMLYFVLDCLEAGTFTPKITTLD
ncbi:hypothetical protein CsSME_00016636 [Camellia sinensis var. sinensis]